MLRSGLFGFDDEMPSPPAWDGRATVDKGGNLEWQMIRNTSAVADACTIFVSWPTAEELRGRTFA
jgi:hypothetical protein